MCKTDFPKVWKRLTLCISVNFPFLITEQAGVHCIIVLVTTIPSQQLFLFGLGFLYLQRWMPALSKVLKLCQAFGFGFGFGFGKACPPP